MEGNYNYLQLKSDDLAKILRRTKSYNDINLGAMSVSLLWFCQMKWQDDKQIFFFILFQDKLSTNDVGKMQELIALKMSEEPGNNVLDQLCVRNLQCLWVWKEIISFCVQHNFHVISIAILSEIKWGELPTCHKIVVELTNFIKCPMRICEWTD